MHRIFFGTQGCHTEAKIKKNISIFFLPSDLGKLAKPSAQTVLKRIFWHQESQLSSATIVPQLSVVVDMTRS